MRRYGGMRYFRRIGSTRRSLVGRRPSKGGGRGERALLGTVGWTGWGVCSPPCFCLYSRK
ncbi:MAG: hypothetical protein AB7G75_19390, partial [Candidatus Binatia bacterium]